MRLRTLLQQAVALKILRPLDVQFALTVASDDEPAVMLAAAMLSFDAGEGTGERRYWPRLRSVRGRRQRR